MANTFLALTLTLVLLAVAVTPSVAKQSKHRRSLPGSKDINSDCIFNHTVASKIRLSPKGSVMQNHVNVYHIWLGNWTEAERQVVDYFVTNLDSNRWFHTVSSGFYGADGQYASSTLTLAGSYHLTQQPYLSQPIDVVNFIVQQSQLNSFAIDGQSIYFVFPSREITVARALSSGTCGWHTMSTVQTTGGPVNMKFGMVFDTTVGCNAQIAYPQGASTYRTQVMIDTIAHEIAEAMTNPGTYSPIESGWFVPKSLEEAADLCSNCYGTVHYDENGAAWNLVVGPEMKRYLAQQIYDPRAGRCMTASHANNEHVACPLTTTTTRCKTDSGCQSQIPNSKCVNGKCKCNPSHCWVNKQCKKFPVPQQTP